VFSAVFGAAIARGHLHDGVAHPREGPGRREGCGWCFLDPERAGVHDRAGTPFEPRNLNRRFETRRAKAGVRRITVHDMRHTCATLLAALDVHPRVAMRILRHAQIDVTMNVYTEVSDAKTLKALKRLGKQLGSASV